MRQFTSIARWPHLAGSRSLPRPAPVTAIRRGPDVNRPPPAGSTLLPNEQALHLVAGGNRSWKYTALRSYQFVNSPPRKAGYLSAFELRLGAREMGRRKTSA